MPTLFPVRRTSAAVAVMITLFSTLLVGLGGGSADAGTIGQQAVSEASRHQGQPYVYGAAGPTRFDCSGFTLYVYGRFGKRLAHSASTQYSQTRHIAKYSKAVGDLIFMRESSGRIGHVGIYAGGNRWWVAPKSGDHVKLQTLYSTNYVVGRP